MLICFTVNVSLIYSIAINLFSKKQQQCFNIDFKLKLSSAQNC